jgi:hypothetical protein
MTRGHPFDGLSIGFRVSVSLHSAIRATGLLTISLAGLSPAERVHLFWTHNQAAAFDRISRSICSRLFSRRRRTSSSRSVVLNPPSPRPSSRSACLTQRLIAQGVGPNCRDRSLSVRPARCSSTIWCRNSFGYRFANFDLAMADTSNSNCRVCTDPGQVHPVAVLNHSGRSNQEGASCKKVDNVDEKKVNNLLKIGRPLGRWGPLNNCQTFVHQVLQNASTAPPPPPPLPAPRVFPY